jgi:hypothetical protein
MQRLKESQLNPGLAEAEAVGRGLFLYARLMLDELKLSSRLTQFDVELIHVKIYRTPRRRVTFPSQSAKALAHASL